MIFQSKKRKLSVSCDFPENKQRKYSELSFVKVRQSCNDFFQADLSFKKWMKKFDFTTMIHQVDLSSFVFWNKLKIPKRHFEINWPLQNHLNLKISVECALVNVHTIFFFSSGGKIWWDNLKISLLSQIFVHRQWKNQNSFTINVTINFLKNNSLKSYLNWYVH